MTAYAEVPVRLVHGIGVRLRKTPFYGGAVGTRTGRVGLSLCGLVLLLGLVGPFFSPYSPSEVVGARFEVPTASHLLGTDILGRDAFSRFLWGGRAMVAVAIAATLLPYAIAIPLGLLSGYVRGPFDLANLGLMDVILAFPPIVFILAVLAATGPRLSAVILAIAVNRLPRIVRITRAVTLDLATVEFVEAAVARGERTASILFREILPNVWTPVLADFGLRLAHSVILFASISFLGVALTPPAADWGLMISENRLGLRVNPWVIIAPAVTIAILTIGICMTTDAVARSVGKRVMSRDD